MHSYPHHMRLATYTPTAPYRRTRGHPPSRPRTANSAETLAPAGGYGRDDQAFSLDRWLLLVRAVS